MVYEYERVIPRDLFNEANLLKCYGKLALVLNDHTNIYRARVEMEDEGSSFLVAQNPDTGGIYLLNVYLSIDGERQHLERPLNSRDPWPLYLEYEGNPIPVFDESGNLSHEFNILIHT